MIVLLEKMSALVILLAVGYACGKLRVVGPEFNSGLSKIVLNVLLPAMILSSVINKELVIGGREMVSGLLMMTVMVLVCFGIAVMTPWVLRMKDGDKGLYRLLVGFMNNGFVGFPLVAAIYGEEWVFYASLSNIPFNILLYTAGVMLLQDRNGRDKLSLKSVLSAPLVATVIAAIIFAFRIHIPEVIADTVSMIGGATVPLSMMCIGLTLEPVPIKEPFIKPRFYTVSLMRLVACPLAVWLVLRLFMSDPTLLGIIVTVSACPSAVVCSILSMKYGRDGIEASEFIFLCMVMSLITMPLLLTALGLT